VRTGAAQAAARLSQPVENQTSEARINLICTRTLDSGPRATAIQNGRSERGYQEPGTVVNGARIFAADNSQGAPPLPDQAGG
jgi:hypothetical protein